MKHIDRYFHRASLERFLEVGNADIHFIFLSDMKLPAVGQTLPEFLSDPVASKFL